MTGIRVDVRHDMAAVRLQLQDVRQELIDGATVRALNRTATTVRAEAARAIHDEYQGLKIGTIKDQVRIVRATRRSLTATVVVSGRPIPLVEFSASQTRAGVTVRVKGARKLVRHAFIATMGSGHRGVFIRKRVGGKLAPRLPIQELMSVSLPVAFTNKKILDALVRVVRERFPEAFAQEARFLQLKKAA